MYEDYFVPFPSIDSARVRLRRMEKRDIRDIYDLCRREELARFVEWYPHKDITETRDYVNWIVSGYRRGRSMTWVIELKGAGKVIGTCGFMKMDADFKTAEIGYCLSSDYWRQGYATEAVWSLLWYGFKKIGLCRVQARVMDGNEPSEALVEKLGFRREGLMKKGVFCKGAPHDITMFGMTDEMYDMMYGDNNAASIS